jgi:hypothetical protein
LARQGVARQGKVTTTPGANPPGVVVSRPSKNSFGPFRHIRDYSSMNATQKKAQPLPGLLTELMIRTHYLPIGSRTLSSWLASGKFPPPDVRTGKLRFWLRATVEKWVEEQTVRQ